MTRTLVYMFHPDPARSKANAALARAAAALPGVEVIDMQAENPDGQYGDGAAEVARLLTADRIVLQFPLQWYSTPPLLRAWQDAVLTRMFYIQYETEGRLLEGTPLMVATTAGNVPEAYRPGGANMFAMTDMLAPLRATANRCGLPWAEPFVLYRAMDLSPEELEAAAADYAETLARWIATPVKRAA
ncbi:NAD(P)H-dependent oxidoreductase [Frigidibacter sp.]|uniref:NAD(P)H-dependent oxidoreductase n=1 Tax=Frigidibacter sp. TaxID=2586418 RepID=UPI0027366BCF|nr:NAD(P)H-dependent oxidoreductase [Frigidibacter sp.]MDP3340830.1 NAD(P)H-dependent oxidoreductase [Frigidibacter sp.]